MLTWSFVVLTCLRKRPEHRYQTVSELMQTFDAASGKQLKVGAVAPVVQSKPDQDWSSAVLEAMSDQSYQKTTQLASQEYSRSKDLSSVASATYRAISLQAGCLILRKSLKQ